MGRTPDPPCVYQPHPAARQIRGRPALRRFLILLAFVGIATPGLAQIGGPPPPPPIQSLEIFAAGSPTIVTATVADSKLDQFEYLPHDVTLHVERVIKGAAETTIHARILMSSDHLQALEAGRHRLLVAIPASPNSQAIVVDLSDPRMAVITEDLTLLRREDDLMAAIDKLLAKPSAKPQPQVFYRWISSDLVAGTTLADLPPSWRTYAPDRNRRMLLVPVDDTLERAGRALVRSRDPADRVEGVRMLANFRSRSNERRLRSLLADPAFKVFPQLGDALLTEEHQFFVRQAAFEVLNQWHVPVDRSVCLETFPSLLGTIVDFHAPRVLNNTELSWLQQATKLRSLELAEHSELFPVQIDLIASLTRLEHLTARNCRIEDYFFSVMARMRNLRSLDLQGSTVSDNVIDTIAAMPRLREVNLAQTRVSDGGIARLTSARPDLRITPSHLGFLHLTKANCTHTVYVLKRPAYDDWSGLTVGRLVGPIGWSKSPSGRDYFGPFGQQAMTLHLANLPKHRNVHIEIELWIIGSWDGDGSLGAGPDVMDIRIPGVGVALHSTFFNNDDDAGGDRPIQSFPDPYPGPGHKAYTGAAEVRTLGFTEPWSGHLYHRDAVYKLEYTFADSDSDLEIVLTGENVVQAGIDRLEDDEHWGIGGLTVKTD